MYQLIQNLTISLYFLKNYFELTLIFGCALICALLLSVMNYILPREDRYSHNDAL